MSEDQVSEQDSGQGTSQGTPQETSPENPREISSRRSGRRPERTSARLFGQGGGQPAEAPQPAAAPPPPPRKKRAGLEAFSGFLTFLMVAAVVATIGAVYANHAIRRPGPLAADKAVVIAQGSDTDDIGDQLATQGVIESSTQFGFALLFEGARGKLKAGEYLFKQGASLQDVIDAIVQGRAVLHAITIPEGLTSRQIVERLREDDALAGDIHEIPREGALLPETYKFQRGDSRDKLLQKMARDQKQLLEDIWRRRASDLPLSSPYDLVTMASIVEKETGKAEERPRVASVFINRLRKHMRLQSDPTIVYGLVGGQGPLGRPLTRNDIDTASPYNTYVIDGLPPGPIANPGRAALEAVANPAHTPDLYFVADGTGGHVFSDSLDSHNRNVQRWRQIEQSLKNKPAPGMIPGASPGAAPGHDDHTRNMWPAPLFGEATLAEEFQARRNPLGGLTKPRLARDPAAIARLAPQMPGAPPAPLRVTDLARPRGSAPSIQFADTFDESQLGGATRAENDLDGPASDITQADPQAKPLANPARTRRVMAGNALDGPAEPVESGAVGSALGYAGGVVNPAPNGKPRILDASEGTKIDPLLNKSWDLNSSKTFDSPPAKTPGRSQN
jgi:UPF0755 protein